jgi:hypothetical protein
MADLNREVGRGEEEKGFKVGSDPATALLWQGSAATPHATEGRTLFSAGK